ncbi:MAG: ABC transporter permease [Actinobacteria bacterium]|nr:ABC transporter permease [Actinomycetota bacterium]
MSLADVASTHGLKRVGARPPLGSYLREAWRRREFIVALAQYRLRASLEGNRLGVLWLVLQPTLNALIYGTIFYFIQRGDDPVQFAAHVVIGVFLFQFFQRSMTQGARSITGNQSLVQSLAFPRITLPVAEVMEELISLLPSIAVLFVILPFLGHWPSLSWLLMVPLLILFTLFNTGIALITARLTVHVRDLAQLLPFIGRLLFYSSGVLFDVNKIFDRYPAVLQLYDFVPIYQVLQMARAALLGGHSYDPMYWLYFSAWSVLTFVVGLLFFWVAEERYGRD